MSYWNLYYNLQLKFTKKKKKEPKGYFEKKKKYVVRQANLRKLKVEEI